MSVENKNNTMAQQNIPLWGAAHEKLYFNKNAYLYRMKNIYAVWENRVILRCLTTRIRYPLRCGGLTKRVHGINSYTNKSKSGRESNAKIKNAHR